MCGKKGMPHLPRLMTLRQQMWQTMRIKAKGFTLPDLMMTVPGSTRVNAQKLLKKLALHGIIRPIGSYTGGRPGEYKGYRLAHNTGPTLPQKCPNCGRRLASGICEQEPLEGNS